MGGSAVRPDMIGNQLWKLRKTHTPRPRDFDTAEDLYKAAEAYFQWVEDYPLFEDRLASCKGEPVHETMVKPRAMSITAFQAHAGIGSSTWHRYKSVPELAEACEYITRIIYAQKFELAAAELLNPAFVSRDLGLAEKQEIDHRSSDGTMSPKKAHEFTDEELAAIASGNGQ
ncbi:MAG: terminase small subunit [Pyrinomonadaceae bacterium]